MKQGRAPIFCMTLRLDLIYMPSNYYHNISKGIKSYGINKLLSINGCTDVRLIALSHDPYRVKDKNYPACTY